MGGERSSSRRRFLSTLGTAAFVGIAGCNAFDTGSDEETPTETPSSTPGDTVTFDPEVRVRFLDGGSGTAVEPVAWQPYEFDAGIDADLPVSETAVQLTLQGPHDEHTVSTADGEEYTPPAWGKMAVDVTVTTEQETTTESSVVETVRLDVQPQAPSEVERDTFGRFLAELEEAGTPVDTFLVPLADVRSNEYTAKGEQVLSTIGALLEDGRTDRAVGLADRVTQHELTGSNLEYIQAAPESTEQYIDALIAEGLDDTFTLTGLTAFEEELYNLEEVLDADASLLKVDEFMGDVRTNLRDEFVQIRDNLLAKGYLTEFDVEYLRTAAAIISRQKYVTSPRYQKARDAGWIPEEGTQITEAQLDALREIRDDKPAPADRYSDKIKETVIGVEADEDVVLVKVEYTEAVDHEEARRLFEEAITELRDRTRITVIGIEGETDADPMDDEEDWRNRMEPQLDDLADKGMHHLYVEKTVNLDVEQADIERAPGKAIWGGVSHYSIVKTDFRYKEYEGVEYGPRNIKFVIKHELAHQLGIYHHWDQSEAHRESIMTYADSWRPERVRFTGNDVAEMREHNYGQQEMPLETIQTWAAEGETLHDHFGEENVLTPAGIELEL